MSKNCWMWQFGEFESYHCMMTNLRRQEYGIDYPTLWGMSPMHAMTEFRKEIVCEKEGWLKAYSTGFGYVLIDNVKRYRLEEKVILEPGEHIIKLILAKTDGLIAAFVESDVCPSDSSWLSNPRAGEFTPVGYNEYFDSPDKDPQVFPFEYERKLPVSKENTDGGVLFDFGKEMFGFVNLSYGDENEKIGVFYGESREEAVSGESAIVFEYVEGQKEYRLRQRAFRYIFVKCEKPDTADANADYEYLPLEQKGNFRCDNELFNRVYDTCIYTFHLNCREGFLDGIKRDRWIWSGDAFQSGRINAYCFADKDIVKRTAVGLAGKKPVMQFMNTIVDYTLLWIIGIYEYYMTYGDEEFLRNIYPMAKEHLGFCETRVRADGFIEGADEDWTFIDWSEIDKTGAVCAEQMLLIMTYITMEKLAKLSGEDGNFYLSKAEELKAKVNEFYWNADKGAFIDSFESGKNNVTRHANIFAVMFDIATKEQKKSILKNVLLNDNITKITTPYFEGFELDALAKLGDFTKIEEMMESYWGAMLSLGATTIWEEFDPTLSGTQHYEMYGGKFAKSLCHAWGAGPVYLFGRYYLGVYPTKPGYEEFNVEPKLGGLSEIKGTVPVNGGSVKVFMNKDKLCVSSDKDGGTLILDEKTYPLIKDKEIVIEL